MKRMAWLLALCFAGQVWAQDIGGAAREFPDSRSKTLVFTDQLPEQLSDEQWAFIASHYVGTQKQTTTWTRHLRQLNPKFIVLHYQLALGCGPAPFVTGDQWTNDMDAVNQHDTWFLHDAAGQRILQTAWKWWVMDIRFTGGQPDTGFPAYWVKSALARMRQNEDDGVFADSYTQDVLMGQVKPKFDWFQGPVLNQKNWLPHLNDFGAYCAQSLHGQKEKFYYLPNLGGLTTKWDTTTNLAVGDGGMNEGFAAPDPGHYYSEADWKLALTRLLSLAKQEKILLCQTSIDAKKQDHRWFVIGSFLLTKGPRSYLNMFQKSSLEWYPEYTLDLGPYQEDPRDDIADYWDDDMKLYKRRYAWGMVLVNPSAKAVPVGQLERPYLVFIAEGGGPVGADGKASGTLKTAPITTLTVPAHSARVLLRADQK